MIPKRQGYADIGATIPTGNGQLPPIPDAPPATPPPPVSKTETTSFKGADVIEALTLFSKVTSKDSANGEMVKYLLKKKLIVVRDNYAVVSEKGLRALVDFVL